MRHCSWFFLRLIGMEKERSRIRAVQTDNFRVLLGIRRMDKVPNAGIREFVKRIDEGVRRWFGHVKRMENR